jgi:hypothetical protein
VLMLYDVAEYGMSDLGTVNIEPNQWFTEFSLPYLFRNDTSRSVEKASRRRGDEGQPCCRSRLCDR